MTSKIKADDICYGALWDKENTDYLKKMFLEVRMGNPQVAFEFDDLLEKSYNDHKILYDSKNRLFQPKQVEKKLDFVTIFGLTRLAALGTGQEKAIFTYYASGTGTSRESRNDQGLDVEHARVSLISSGYQTSAGPTMKYAGFFTTGIASAVITEGGVTDDVEGGTFFFRSVLPRAMTHVQFDTVYTLTQTILLVSVS